MSMGQRFGFKDLVLLLAVLLVCGLVVLNMIQQDRAWRRVESIAATVGEQEKRIGELAKRLDGVFESNQRSAAGSDRHSAFSGQPESNSPDVGSSSSRDESWARPGVAVVWAKARGFENDPRLMNDYAPGGTLVEAIEGTPAKLTPYVYGDTFGRRVNELVTEGLADFDDAGRELRGVLAEAWQYDPKGMWLRAKIRDNARFSDGSPVTAEDVRFTFHDYIFNAEIQAERYRANYDPIRKVTAVSERVVEFEFAQPRFNNDQLALRFPVLPKKFYAAIAPAAINTATGLLVGSGPYRLDRADSGGEQWKPGEDVVLVRNEQYWGDEPAIQEIRLRPITDAAARMAALESRSVDLMRPTFEQYAKRKDDPAFLASNAIHAWANIRSGYSYIAWNCGERKGKLTPFHDARVRVAMTMLINRERIRSEVYEGLGLTATGPFNPLAAQADSAIVPWACDLERAKALLTEAGWVDRDNNGVRENDQGEEFAFEITVATSSDAGKRIGAHLKDRCALAGVRCGVNLIDAAGFEAVRRARDFDAITMIWSPSDPEIDPRQIWHSDSIRDQGDNFAQWSNTKADELIDRGRAEMDPAKRMELWHELHRVIHEEQPYTFVCNLPWVRFVGKRVRNVREYPMGMEYREWYIQSKDQ
ncbi:MAG TPA: ABC transporter substrate-binding protein [Phycisphaerales bacterium]|nr:ABC transporter substrate-binding protein [Phycisphaerales bacterium]